MLETRKFSERRLYDSNVLAPNTTISYTPAWAPNFVTISTTFTLAGSDNAGGSGVVTRFYNINGSGWVAGNTFNLGGWTNGTISIMYRSTDHVGNTEAFGSKYVRLDTIVPITGISYTVASMPDFVNATTSFKLTFADNMGGSGIASTQYQYTGSGGYHYYTAPFMLSSATNGTITINFRSTDNAGNVETVGTLFVRLDALAPNTTMSYVPAWAPNFVTASTTFTLAGSDNAGGSGLATRFYNINGSGWVAGSSFNLGGWTNGTITIMYRSVDLVGNTEVFGTKTVRIDTIAPVTGISYTAMVAPNFVSTATPFTLTPVDNTGGSGVASTQYQYTGSSGYHVYTAPFVLSSATNGTITINYYSIDHFGNVETANILVVRLDTLAPTTGISYTPVFAPNFVSTATPFTLTPADNMGGSGIATTQYQYTGSGGYHVYTAPFVLSSATNGTITINYRSTDNVGNVETAGALVVRIDTLAPNTTISYTPAWAPNFVTISTTFTLAGSDNAGGSGVATRFYNINGSGWVAGNTFNLGGWTNGTISIMYRSTDHVGNTEAFGSKYVRLDTIVPITGISYTVASMPDFVNATTSFKLTFADNMGGSGIASTQYQYTGSGGYHYYTAPFMLSSATNGTITINFRSTDNAGNVETVGTLFVRLDALAPNTTMSYVPAWAPNFVTASTTFTLAGSDNAGGSGLATRFYNINGSGWVAGSSFNLGGWTNGTITIMYRSVDLVGNTEVFGTKTVRIDTIAPVTGISYTAMVAPNFVSTATPFTLTPVDNTGGSGVASTQYQYTGSSGYHVYTAPFVLSSATNGTITINYYSIDHVGNVETANILVVRLDTLAPTTGIS